MTHVREKYRTDIKKTDQEYKALYHLFDILIITGTNAVKIKKTYFLYERLL